MRTSRRHKKKIDKGFLIAKRDSSQNLNSFKLPNIITTAPVIFNYYLVNTDTGIIISTGTHVNYDLIVLNGLDITANKELWVDLDKSFVYKIYFHNDSNITWLDLRDLSDLKEFFVANNNLTEILFNFSNKITRFQTIGNFGLLSIDLEKMPLLNKIEAGNNNTITSLNFTSNPLLSWLNLDTMSNLTTIDLTNCINELYRIFMKNCNINHNIDLTNRPKLYSTDFRNNNILSIADYTGSQKLQYCYLDGNPNLSTIKITSPLPLYISFDNCNVDNLGLTLPQMDNITTISAVSNNLSGDFDLSNCMFSQPSKIDLKNNDITRLNVAFNGMTNISVFELTGNPNLATIHVRTQDLAWCQANLTDIGTGVFTDTPF